MNFKKLFLMVLPLAGLLFSCDPKEPAYTIPEITVTDAAGAEITTVSIPKEGGDVQFKVAANLPWSIDIPSSATWLGVNPLNSTNKEQKAKTTVVTVSAEANTGDMRSVTATITMDKTVVEVTISQESGIVRDYQTIASIRALYTDANVTITPTGDATAVWVKGTVVSNARKATANGLNNFGSAKILIIQDATAGIEFFCSGEPNFAPGDIVEANIAGATLSPYSKALQLSNVTVTNITKIGSETLVAKEISAADLLTGNYEWQYVAVKDVQVVSADLSKKIGEGSAATTAAGTEIGIEAKTGESLVIYSGKYATPLKDIVAPQGSGTLKGIAGRFNDTFQIYLTYTTDIDGMSGARFTPDYSSVTIDKITEAGNYQIENATVVGTHTKGILVKDATGTILVFLNATHTFNVGDVVTVKGAVEARYDLFQFTSSATVTKTSTTTFTQPTPSVLTAAEVDAYPTAPSYKYVQVTGTLSISDNYRNLTIDGATVKGSIAYPAESLGLAALDTKVIKVTGYAVGYSGSSQKYLNIMAIDAQKDSSATTLSVTPASLTWAAAEVDAKTVTVTTNAASWSMDSSAVDSWATVTKEGNTITVTPKAANTSDANKTGDITITAGEKTVKLLITQKTASSGTGYTKVTSAPSDWSGTYLIVYETSTTQGNVFNGKDAASDFVTATISSGTIAEDNSANEVQIASMTGGYSIKILSGDNKDKYISGKLSSGAIANGLLFNAEAAANTITLESDGTVSIVWETGIFTFNSTSGQTRFRYYKPTTVSGDSKTYKYPCLYKKN